MIKVLVTGAAGFIGSHIQILGYATHADRMFFNPQLIQVEHN